MEKTTNAKGNANSNANADLSPLKGIRDDSREAFFRAADDARSSYPE
jgi:hypothetical protein